MSRPHCSCPPGECHAAAAVKLLGVQCGAGTGRTPETPAHDFVLVNDGERVTLAVDGGPATPVSGAEQAQHEIEAILSSSPTPDGTVGASVVHLEWEDNHCSYCGLVGRHLLTCHRAGEAVTDLEAALIAATVRHGNIGMVRGERDYFKNERDTISALARDAAGLLEESMDDGERGASGYGTWRQRARDLIARWRETTKSEP